MHICFSKFLPFKKHKIRKKNTIQKTVLFASLSINALSKVATPVSTHRFQKLPSPVPTPAR